MANYIDSDGDWVRRFPFSLEGVTAWLFLLAAKTSSLQALCDRFTRTDADGNVVLSAKPLLSLPTLPLLPDRSAILLAMLDITNGHSTNPLDTNMGFVVERDMGVFVPVELNDHGVLKPAAIIPYLYVDNPSAVVAGREMYGFPKTFATLHFDQVDLAFKAMSLSLTEKKSAERVKERTVLEVGPPAKKGPPVPLPVAALDDVAQVTGALVTAVYGLLGIAPPAGPGFTSIRILTLKQFRSATTDEAACFQSIVQVEMALSNFTEASVLPDLFTVKVPPLAFPSIEGVLGLVKPLTGLPCAGSCDAFGGFRVKLDFDLPLGKEVV